MCSTVDGKVTTVFDLGGFCEDFQTAVERLGLKQKVFGCLVQMATDPNHPERVEHYQSDLYHDAMWLDKYLVSAVNDYEGFFFGFDEWGTAIGTDRSLVSRMRKNVYRCTLQSNGSGSWTLSVT